MAATGFTKSKPNGKATESKRKSTFDVPTTSRKRNCSGAGSIYLIPLNPSCLFCLNPAIITDTDIDPMEYFMMYRNLCIQMMKQNEDDIPSEISQFMFPACCSCEQLAQNLWHCQLRLEETERKILEIKSTFKNVVGDAVVLKLDMHIPFSTPSDGNLDERPFTKLRDVILKAHQSDLWEQKSQMDSAKSTALSDQIDPIGLNDELVRPKTTKPSHSAMEGEEMTSLNDEAIGVKIKQEPIEVPDEQGSQLQSAPKNSLGNSESRREGVLILEKKVEFELYWTSSEVTKDTAFLNCGKCSHVVPFLAISDDGMETAYRNIQTHASVKHSHEVWASTTTSEQFPCRMCDVIFKEASVRERHECLHHRTYNILGAGSGLLTEEERKCLEREQGKNDKNKTK
ncbi:unnamed protein product [Orchesella dallaii]|uniref:C2H2-type domain-containing protein n=1 Tax=Orchesella dallaii TaxID=48710 RepID=A0ABP1PVI6_9HEXA